MGSVYDRNGNTLASTDADGRRVYLQDETARRALSQTGGDTAGMSGTGVEPYYSATLLDLSGNLIDRLRELFTGSEHKGSSVQITVDAELTAYIASVFPKGYEGAVCVINYKTGEILAIVSMPEYDPASLDTDIRICFVFICPERVIICLACSCSSSCGVAGAVFLFISPRKSLSSS